MATAELHEGEIVRELSDPMESASTLMALNSSEIDTQIATAKRYPRSIKQFRNEAMEMVTLTEDIAGECIYSLPRGGKPIEGPSARFAEIVASAWGNARAGARIISEDEKFVTAQGAFFDLQRNVAITYEVKRRITDKSGHRFKDDMIGVTANAACSIALRNAILKGVPKAFWRDLYEAARATAIGNAETLSGKRAKMLQAFAKMGVQPEQVFKLLEVGGEQDITLDHLAQLRGVFTAIKEGDTTIEQIFEDQKKPGSKATKSKLNDTIDEPANPTEATVESVKALIASATNNETLLSIGMRFVGPDSPEGQHFSAEEWTAIEKAGRDRSKELETPKGKGGQKDLIDRGSPNAE